jgi:maleate isomerase
MQRLNRDMMPRYDAGIRSESAMNIHLQTRTHKALGRTARLGLIIPQLDLLSEPLFSSLLPDGVSIHTARMRRRGPVSSASLEAMNANLQDAIDLLPTPYIDAVVYNCTMGSLLYEPDKLKVEISERAGVAAISTTSSVVEALRHLKIKELCLISPYSDELNKAEIAFFERTGFSVCQLGGENLHDAIEMARVAPEEISAWTRKAWTPECKGVFITCTGLRSSDYICELEAQLGVPVITSSSAVLWDLCRVLKLPMTGVPLGCLFDHTSDSMESTSVRNY